MALAYLALAWVLGVAAAAFTGGSAAASVAAIGLLGAVSFARRPRASTLLFIALGAVAVLLAGWRYEATAPPQTPYGIARNNDSEVRFRATVSGEPDVRASSRLYRLDVTHVFLGDGWRREPGGVEMRAPLHPEYRPGDLLEVEGELLTPASSPDFDYREYLLRRGIVSTIEYPQVWRLRHGDSGGLASLLSGVRSRLSDSLSDALPEPQASLAAGILLGNRSNLPRDLRDDMNATGTSHLTAVSGQNVMMVAGLLIAVLTALAGRRRAAWLSLAGIIAYAALVGLQPSVLRATIMGSLYIISLALGRQNAAAITLLLAAAGLTAVNPQTVHDISFQLSFAAALGLVLLAPLLRDRLVEALPPSAAHLPFARAGVELVAVTAAAIAFTLPITAVNFHRVSLVAPLANLFAVPAFVGVAATAGVAALAGPVPVLGDLAAWLAWLPAAYMVAVVRFFADVPFASIELRDVSVGHAIAYYALLWAAVWWMSQRLPVRPEPPPQPAPLDETPACARVGPGDGADAFSGASVARRDGARHRPAHRHVSRRGPGRRDPDRRSTGPPDIGRRRAQRRGDKRRARAARPLLRPPHRSRRANAPGCGPPGGSAHGG